MARCSWGGCRQERTRWLRWHLIPQTDGYCDDHATLLLGCTDRSAVTEVQRPAVRNF